MNATSEVRIEQLYPPLKIKAYQLIMLASNKGIDVEVSQGLRTWPQQAALYAQGRTSPGIVVTHAKPGESWHNFALAFDIFINTSHGIDWTGTDSLWQTAISIGESLGLVSGSEWHGDEVDRPHFQYTGRFPVTPDDEVMGLFTGGGIQAVWDEVDK